MANLSLTRVNQKLAQARLLIVGVDEESLAAVHRNSLMEAAAFHLICAYQHYLRELAEAYGLKPVIDVRTEVDLATAFEAAKKHPAEADELLVLRNDSHSWLFRLQGYYESLWHAPKPSNSQSNDQSNDNLISSVNLDVIADLISMENLREWHSDFVALVMRQRETSAEF